MKKYLCRFCYAFVLNVFLWGARLIVVGVLCEPSVWAFSFFSHSQSPTNPQGNSYVQNAPDVTLQTSPDTLKQVKDFFDHASYQDFGSYNHDVLFKIPSEQFL
ncbi:MAG: hypothetical protein A3C55_01880 [Gammaproteobacteria bacterium RIFCSPHIGHO2_02_FULL_42_13]|nr:MAG: hypothetical protein A3C55_01880 [Gammaproteobacteria bacterium RIFCSPHIGHO2_02_FULL_42_13]OGT70040.1 MAG: hypothetical protein A3H43_05745 [Gammaproteobacteria bacterium RIFCSPLOWO2_02_FULL_42_9]